MKRARWISAVLIAASAAAFAADAPPPAPLQKMPPPVSPEPVASADPMDLVLPDMKFRDATVADILDWIREKSREADPAGVGANILLMDDARGTVGATRLTIALTRPTVRRALDLMASAATLYIRQDARAIVVRRSTAVVGAP